jgi:glycosyltransferase involved in cell wall biosynthesis
MKISIITINLNNIRGLGKTIESVFDQAFYELEYLVIDGGSTDGSVELLQQNNDRIAYWISEPDSGVFQAMNKGIRKATGEYLLFLNSGDFLLHDHVLNSVFKGNPQEDILCGTSLITRNGTPLYYSAPPDFFTLRFFCNRNIPHQSTFIKRNLFEKHGYYREDFKIKSDYEFWIRAIILNNCNTRKLNILISDYNLEGISSDPGNVSLARTEMKKALELNIPQPIWGDYIAWFEYPSKMEILIWARSNSLVFNILSIFYKIASGYFRLRSKLKKIRI